MTAIPFVVYLLAVAVVPLLLPRFWEKNRNKLWVALAAAIPAAAIQLSAPHGGAHLLDSLKEYAAFMALLGALFIISGGVHVQGSLAGTPTVNTALLAAGAVLASVIGTTGASMLLIRPLLRSNERRQAKTHLIVFFIFIVSNAGGLLTPLGDPPLFLGFLRGVPFLWTLGLWGPWAMVNGVLLLMFFLFDRTVLHREKLEIPAKVAEPLRLQGAVNFVWLLGVVAVNAVVGAVARRNGWSEDLQKLLLVGGTALMAGLSMATTPKEVRRSNRFAWHPIVEVAVVFIGIFVTVVPAIRLLEAMGESGAIRATHAWHFFWATGVLSSILDNAPTYLTFASLACGVVGGQAGQTIDPSSLDQLLAFPRGALYLRAISCGAVFMGAATYIGNGPNFMVKAIAEEHQVKMPGFFGYMAWSAAILVPLFVVVTLVFFRT